MRYKIQHKSVTTEIPSTTTQETVEETVPVVGIVVTCITVGVLFFFIGFFVVWHGMKRGTKYEAYKKSSRHKKGEYNEAPQVDESVPQQYSEMIIVHDDSRESTPVPNFPPPKPAHTRSPKKNSVEVALREVIRPEVSMTTLQATPSSIAAGEFLSPIDIDPLATVIDPMLEQADIVFDYVLECSKTVTNTGFTVKVDVDELGSVISGGPMGRDRYCLDHIHFHWGASSRRGSEHTVGGRSFAGEVHLVHWNQDVHSSFVEAAGAISGLAVLAVFIQVSDRAKGNAALAMMADCLPSIQYKGESRVLPMENFDPASLLPVTRSAYWTYTGSLSMPQPCGTVTWVVFRDPIHISSRQMRKFRRLVRHERGEGVEGDQYLMDNFKTPSPVKGRTVLASFMY